MTISVIIACVVSCLAVLAGMLHYANKAGEAEEKLKEAEARAKNIENIKRAADAEPTGSVYNDPNNLDR